MLLNDYINENFPNFSLRPPLFYNWEIGIRFELGVGWDRENNYENSPYVQRVYKRAITLFESLHTREKEDLEMEKLNTKRGFFLPMSVKNQSYIN